MNFDFEATFKQMIDAAQGAINENMDGAKTVGEQFLNTRKDAVKRYAEQRLANEIDDDDLKELLADELKILHMEKNAGIAIGKATAQKAINAALQVLETAVRAALNTIL